MSKNSEFVSHKKSKLKVNGKPQLPSANALVEGEIAINFAKDVETLSIKNESGDVVTFSSDNYYTEQKLGSGFTGANSATTVTKALDDMEFVVSTALTDLENNKQDTLSAGTGIDITNDVISVTGGSSITVDQVLDNTTSASTNAVATQAVYSAVTDNELVWTNAYVALSGIVSAHTASTTAHGIGQASGVTSMAEYQTAFSTSQGGSISDNDTLLQAIARLEKRIQTLENNP